MMSLHRWKTRENKEEDLKGPDKWAICFHPEENTTEDVEEKLVERTVNFGSLKPRWNRS